MAWWAHVKRAHHMTEWLYTPFSRAFLKAFVFGLLLFRVEAYQYHWFSVLLFLVWSVYIFVTPVSRRFSAPISYASLVILALLMPSRFTIATPAVSHVLPEHVFALLFGALCCIYCLSAGRVFFSWLRSYELLHAGLLWGASLLFISGQEGLHPIRALIIGALFFYALTTEYLTVHGHAHRRTVRLAAIVLTLCLTEFAWALRLLPLSVGYSAALLALLGIIGTVALEQYSRGTLRGRFVRYSVTVFITAALLVALLTNWVI